MSSGQAAERSDDEVGGLLDFGYEWVTTCRVDDFVKRLRAMREGDSKNGEKAQPGAAMRALRAFAIKRPIAELVESAEFFDYDADALEVLATAALCRGVKEAAELAIKQWDTERATDAETTPRTDGIIHEVACQRIALDVAEFVGECHKAKKSELVDKTLRVFARTSSGRTNLDKARLYIALRDEDCNDEAEELLGQTLAAFGEDGSTQTLDTDPAELHDLVGALRRLSPSERILEEWIDEKLGSAPHAAQTIQLVVRLIASRPDYADTLVEHVGQQSDRDDLISVCSQLFELSPKKFAAVRAHAASRKELRELGHIVRDWHKSETLVKTTKDLLADIVARGIASATGPRSLDDLDELDRWLRIQADPECNRLLWIAAAVHIDGRSGADLATRLSKVERRRDRQRAAQTIAERLTARLLEAGADNDNEKNRFISYISTLRDLGDSEGVYSARRELADPIASDRPLSAWAALIAEIAVGLYQKGWGDDGWDLLERCLENEQRVTRQDVAVVVDRLCDSRMKTKMDEQKRGLLLRATVGRWSDAHRRDEAINQLRHNGFEAEATEVIRSIR